MKKQNFNIFAPIIIVFLMLFVPNYAKADDENIILDEINNLSSSTTTVESVISTTTQCVELDPVTTTASHLSIRYNDTIILDKDIALTTTTYHDVINNIDYPLNGTSTVFSLLVNADQQNDNFTISDAQFTAWANSFYVKCINLTIATSTENKCDNWQYTVNSSYPNVGMDKTELSGNENVYIYFGDRYNLTTEKTEFYTNEIATSTLKEYNYSTNIWELTNGQNVLATEAILSDWSNYPPPTLQTSTTTNGLALFQFSTTGTYYITLPDSYWPGVNITVTSTPTTTEEIDNKLNDETPNTPPTTGGGGGGYNLPTHNTLNTANAIQFLTSKQSADGAIGPGMYSDWAAIAFSAYGVENDAKSKLKQYLLADPAPAGGLNEMSNYARRAMSLMSLNINPYNGVATNYIKKITDSFDGTQFNDVNLYNDDIFALLVLPHAGYTKSDPQITSTTKFILSKQNTNGAWDGVDMTSAAIQALIQVKSLDGVDSALGKAKEYLKTQQQADGGWGNVPATSWAMQAIAALGENPNDWEKNNKNPNDYLSAQQMVDGGLETSSADVNTRIWSTSYAVPAALGKNWNNILNNFSVPENHATNNNENFVGGYPENLLDITQTPTSTVKIEASPTTTTGLAQNMEKPIALFQEKLLSTDNVQNQIGDSVIDKPQKTTNTRTTKPQPNLSEESIAENDERKPNEIANKIIDELPLDTPTRKTAKKVLAVSGGSAVAIGLYFGLRIIKNMI